VRSLFALLIALRPASTYLSFRKHPRKDSRMKFASKLIMAVAMGATALTTLAGMASAQDAYAVTKYEYTRDEGVDTHGLTFGLSGAYETGFAYDMELMTSDTDGTGMTGADVELGYRFSGVAGPVALYEYRKMGGSDADQFLIGVEGGMAFGDADVFGKLLVDTDDEDVYRISAGVDYALGNHLSLNGELTHFQNVGSADANLLEVGARYHLTGNMHADVGAQYGRADGGAERTGLHLGLGFDF